MRPQVDHIYYPNLICDIFCLKCYDFVYSVFKFYLYLLVIKFVDFIFIRLSHPQQIGDKRKIFTSKSISRQIRKA